MIRPVRLRLSRAAGFDLQAASRAVNGLPAIVVARPSRWGNPFIVGRDGERAHCVDLHARLIAGHPCVTARASASDQGRTLAAFRAGWRDLVGHNLACWCAGSPPAVRRTGETGGSPRRAKLKGGADGVCHADNLLAAVVILEKHDD